MKTASISELKQELQNISAKQMEELCIRLAKFKKENKELLNYLLFEAHDVEGYTEAIKIEMSELFKEVNIKNLYIAKKNLRRILRNSNKYVKYTGDKQTEAMILIHFCTLVKTFNIPIKRSAALQKLYDQQIKKILAAINSLHEDIQYDLLKEVSSLS
ncbi:hypothetical protein [Ferruginibacter albus]|uniref:hypothetical protein n=1 Tax=Ferruginibacter albus TaxID=2875540 RepID=UPI001CC3AA15|nr:hypothetical protein [Ferruginibacter albus]UAY51221.1 hypothetical protein K9M53_11540 [Ferruginibacter albus]